MPYTKLPNDLSFAASRLAVDVGRLFGAISPESMGSRGHVSELFEIWSIALDADGRARGDQMRDVAHRTGVWHGSIRVDGEVRAFARFIKESEASGQEVFEVRESGIGVEFDLAVEWLDVKERPETEVRLLEIPRFLALGFWILDDGKDDDRILTLCSGSLSNIKSFQTCSTRHFLDALAQAPSAYGFNPLGEAGQPR